MPLGRGWSRGCFRRGGQIESQTLRRLSQTTEGFCFRFEWVGGRVRKAVLPPWDTSSTRSDQAVDTSTRRPRSDQAVDTLTCRHVVDTFALGRRHVDTSARRHVVGALHGELQGICLGAEGDPLGIHGGSAPKSGDPAISRLLALEF